MSEKLIQGKVEAEERRIKGITDLEETKSDAVEFK